MKRLLKSRKALSPVIATVILVSVTIVVAVSVAYWMGSIAGTYTRFEKVEIPTAYSNKVDDWTGDPNCPSSWSSDGGSGWNVTFVLKNSGSADATIDNVFINGKPYEQFANATVRWYDATGPQLSPISLTVNAGAEVTIEILVRAGLDESQDITFSSGTALDIKLHSAAGKEYPKLLELT
jgi:flagellin-like protein